MTEEHERTIGPTEMNRSASTGCQCFYQVYSQSVEFYLNRIYNVAGASRNPRSCRLSEDEI